MAFLRPIWKLVGKTLMGPVESKVAGSAAK
jgi:hypothetical protein